MDNLSGGNNAKGFLKAVNDRVGNTNEKEVVTIEKKAYDKAAYKKTMLSLAKKAAALQEEFDKLAEIRSTKELGDAQITFSNCLSNIEKVAETV